MESGGFASLHSLLRRLRDDNQYSNKKPRLPGGRETGRSIASFSIFVV